MHKIYHFISERIHDMDLYVKFTEEKSTDEKSVHLHEDTERRLSESIREKKNIFLSGAPGVGKTYLLKRVLGDAIEILPEHLRSKSSFLFLIQHSEKSVYIEDYDETPSFRVLVNEISAGRRLTKGAFVATTKTYPVFKGFETILIPRHEPRALVRLVDDPTRPDVLEMARRAAGNIRQFLNQYENRGEDMDDFRGPKSIMHDILTGVNREFNEHALCEHGHMADIMHENYLATKQCDFYAIARSFSDADVFDEAMYTGGVWDIMYAYVNASIRVPTFYLGEPMRSANVRPGSGWTKYGNARQRQQKLRDISHRTSLGADELRLLRVYGEFKDFSKLMEYRITPQDFDVMNHICVNNRLKPRDVTMVKRRLRDEYERNGDVPT